MSKNLGEIRIGVYGTLKTNEGNHILMEKAGARFIGYDCLKIPYTMVSLGAFPALIASEGLQNVYVEVWGGDRELLKSCDYLEGHPDWYKRIKFFASESEVIQKRYWVYIMQHRKANENTSFVSHNIWNPSNEEVGYWKEKGHKFKGVSPSA
jgi:gamma-glutamylcyclotransferase (GGCT)/AIG2-like uncharacterized protein YtfP